MQHNTGRGEMPAHYRQMLDSMPLNRAVSARDIVNAGGATTGFAVGYILRRLPEYVSVGYDRAIGRSRYTKFREAPAPTPVRDGVRVAMTPVMGGNGSSSIRRVPVSLPREPWSVQVHA